MDAQGTQVNLTKSLQAEQALVKERLTGTVIG